MQDSLTLLNLRAAARFLAKLYWKRKLPRLYIIINGTDLSEDTDHVNEFSLMIHNDLTKLDKIIIVLDAAQRIVACFLTFLQATNVFHTGYRVPLWSPVLTHWVRNHMR